MKKIITTILSLLNILTVQATDYDTMWKAVERSLDIDMPKNAMADLQKICKAAENEKNYGELLAAKLKYARVEAEVTPDSLTPAINRLKADALKAEQMDEVLGAVYNTVLAKICTLAKLPEGSEPELSSADYFDRALRNPDLLAATKTDAYKRLVIQGYDDNIMNNDMLSLIGHEAGRYEFLRDYYKSHGNRVAACAEEVLACRNAAFSGDDLGITRRKNRLVADMEEYRDQPISALFAHDYYNILLNDDDVSEQTKYEYIVNAINKYVPFCEQNNEKYYSNTLRNDSIRLIRSHFDIIIDDKISITGIRNVDDIKLEFIRIKADGRESFRIYEKAEREKVLKKATGYVQTVNCHYERPIWEIHSDELPIPQMPYGVYIVKASAKGIEQYTMMYYSDLAVLNIGKPESSSRRLVVVSKTTGAPVPNATIQLSTEKYNGDIERSKTLTTNAEGEAMYIGKDLYRQLYVSTPDDKAFRTISFYVSSSFTQHREKHDIVSVFCDRSIYRPGQTVKGAAIVHHAEDTDDIHTVVGKSLSVYLYDPDGKTIASQSVKSDEMGNVGFEFKLPTDGKNGTYSVRVDGSYTTSASATIRVEEYKRPTFEVTVVDADKYSKTMDLVGDSIHKTVDVLFKANTFSQIPVQDATVTYSIRRVYDNWFLRYYSDRRNLNDRTVVEASTIEPDKHGIISVPLNITLPENDYCQYAFVVHISVTDRAGETHEQEVRVRVRRVNPDNASAQTAPKEDEVKPFEVSSNKFPRDNGKITVTINNAGKTYLYYTFFAGDSIVESKMAIFDSKYTRELKYNPSYGEALTVSYAWVKNGKVFSESATLLKPQPELTLPVKWTTFRDRTQPGSKETWSLKVGTATDMPKATLIATIYDKSLDAISPLHWYMNVIRNYYYSYCKWMGRINPELSMNCYSDYKTSPANSEFRFAHINTEILPYQSFYPRYFRERVKLRKGVYADVMPEAMPMVMAEKKAEAPAAKASVNKSEAADAAPAEEPAVDLSAIVRTNLEETAFFTPSLLTDEEGNINLSFTLPETMTTWRFLGLVHDNKMRHEIVDATCVAQKDIVVKPNVPRFLREDDKAAIAATVSNTTDHAYDANIVMQLLIPETNEIVWQHSQKMHIDAEGSVGVTFDIPAISNDSLLVYRIAATTADGASDGEQHYVPVLPGTELVTTSIAFTQHEPGTYSKDISDMFFQLSRDRSLKVKYAPHAVQMILDAVPVVANPDRRDALSLAAAMYVGSLFPQNAELLTTITNELSDLQSGGLWPWWKGMKGSIYTTAAVARLLARMDFHGVGTDRSNRLLTNSLSKLIDFCCNEAADLRKLQKKYPKEKFHPSETCTDILYIFALAKNSGNTKAESLLKSKRKDVNYLMDLLENAHTEFTIYGKAHAAVLLGYYGRTKKALEHLESMKQYSVYTEEAGRYYDTRKASYSWRNYRIPTEVAAIEALRVVAPEDTVTVEEMKRWLLHEKRTQAWDNSLNTADAVYAFMLDNDEVDYLRNNPSAATSEEGINITLDSTPLSCDTTINVTDAHQLKVEKSIKGTSWGAVFVTQRAPLASLKTTGTGLSVRREIISDNAELHVGDRITVRITIDADRDYDCIELCDRRAACLEPVQQLSGYSSAITGGTAWGSYSGYYRITHDNNTEYFFDRLAKGTHVIETDYYVDRVGTYNQGSCTVRCTYAPEYNALQAPQPITVK